MGEWKSRNDSEGHQEPASTLAGTSAAEERDVPVEVFLLADLSIILRLGSSGLYMFIAKEGVVFSHPP